MYLDPEDCLCLQYCQIEIIILDVESCSIDAQPIARQDYSYGQPTVFTDLTISNAKVRICARIKPGTSCGYSFYPKCDCQNPSYSMQSYLDVCNP